MTRRGDHNRRSRKRAYDGDEWAVRAIRCGLCQLHTPSHGPGPQDGFVCMHCGAIRRYGTWVRKKPL